jgi:hydroxymethylbilane synthase
VLICRGTGQRETDAKLSLRALPSGAVVGTSSTRRRAQLLAQRPDLKIVELRGNIISRLQRLACRPELNAIVLAAAGMERLGFQIASDGRLLTSSVNADLRAGRLGMDVMLPCVGQGALGIEVRENDKRTAEICARLNHLDTAQCAIAERAFLAAMGGGCASPLAAYAELDADLAIQMRAISFPDGTIRRAAGKCQREQATELGVRLAEKLKSQPVSGPSPKTGPISAEHDLREPSSRL